MAGGAGRKSKIKIAAGAAAVLIVAVTALPFLIDADQFRPQIESRLYAELGRDVRLGKLRLSLFSGRLSVDDISIMDNPQFGESPFVTARSFYIGVKISPLVFSKEIQITKISLEHPSIYLRQSSKGEWNVSSLGAKTGGKAETPAEKSGQAAEIRIERLQIIDGRVEIVQAGKTPAAFEKVTITVDNLSRYAVSPFTFASAFGGEGAFNLQGTFGPVNRDNTLMTPLEAALEITRLDPAASGFIPADAGFSGMFDFRGNLSSDGGTARSKGNASVTNMRLVAGGTPSEKPVSLEYDLFYDLKNKTGALTDVTVGLGKAAMRLHGDFDASGDVANIKMTFKGSGVPVDELTEFLPSLGITLPKGAALTGGTLDTEISSNGFLNNPAMDGSVEITGTTLAGFDLGDKIAPIASFAGLKSDMDTKIEKLSASMRWATNGITVNNVHLVVPALGEISGAGTISPRQELDLTMRINVTHGALTALTKGKAIETGFFIRGSASDPEFVPDYNDVARILIDNVLTGKESGASPVNQLMDTLKGLLKK